MKKRGGFSFNIFSPYTGPADPVRIVRAGDGREIANGDALVTFAMMTQGLMDPAGVERKGRALLEYCERDTLAMVRLHEVVDGRGNGI